VSSPSVDEDKQFSTVLIPVYTPTGYTRVPVALCSQLMVLQYFQLLFISTEH
jgi:hypothetical protein